MHTAPNRRVGVIATLALLLVAALSACGGSPFSASPSMETIANATGVSQTKPLTSTQADADPRTAQVRPGGSVHSWNELNRRYGNDTLYTQCAERELGIDWSTDVPKFETIEKTRTGGTTFILASNVAGMNDNAVRAFAKKEWSGLPDNTPIRRTPYFENTMDGTCKPFIDKRSIIRLALAVPTNQVGDPISATGMMGIFHGCKNPWKIPSEALPSTPAPSTSGPSSSPSTSSPTPSPSTSLFPKDPSKDPANNGNAGNGGGKNADPGPGQYQSPGTVHSPPATHRENPAPPQPTKASPPKVKPSSAAPTTVAPSAQPTNDGVVATEPGGCNNPDFC